MLQGFKEFITRGNAVDLAVGVVIGAAFGQVITALTDGIIMPLVAALFGQPDFDNLFSFNIHLFGPPTTVYPGMLITALINFLLVALALYFVVVAPLNKLAARQAAKDGGDKTDDDTPPEITLLEEIRDSLREATGGSAGKHSG